jgi:hypothetical protein
MGQAKEMEPVFPKGERLGKQGDMGSNLEWAKQTYVNFRQGVS